MRVLVISIVSFLSVFLFVGATDNEVKINDTAVREDSLYRSDKGDSVIYLKNDGTWEDTIMGI